MPTIVDTLLQLGQDFRDGIAAVRGMYSDFVNVKNTTISSTTAIVNSFYTRPVVQTFYCDPINGSDANDGKTIDTPKKSFDGVLQLCLTQPSSILLMNDAVQQSRYISYAALSLTGIQKSGAAPGYVGVTRRITPLGTATNSPQPGIGSFCAGLWCSGANVVTNGIDFALQDVPAEYFYRSYFHSSSGASFNLMNGTVTVTSQNAGQLIDTLGQKSSCALSLTLGAGATGHLFARVAAGANPNTLFNYTTNITSA